MKKTTRKKLIKGIRNIQLRLYFHWSESEHAQLNFLCYLLSMSKKRRKGFNKGYGNNFFSDN